MKFCVNCKYYNPSKTGFADYSKCGCPHIEGAIDLVTGEASGKYCDRERTTYGSCGPKGKYFEPKEGFEMPEESKSFWEKLFSI